MIRFVWELGLLGLVGAAGVVHFGWLEGLAILAALYLLMPYNFVSRT